MNNAPVGILDSDIGGLSVVNEFHRLCPSEDILYFADTAHYPYGTKSPQDIFRYFEESTHFLIERGVKAILCACSTASAVALPHFQSSVRIPLIGMLNVELVKTTFDTIKNGEKLNKSHPKIGLIATQLTVKSRAFEILFQSESSFPVELHSQIATDLVNAVTEGDFSPKKITPLLDRIFKTFPLSDLGALIIGCTHFYHLREQIRDFIYPIPLIEPSQIASLCLKQHLADSLQGNGVNPTSGPIPIGHKGKITCFVSGDLNAFERRVRALEKAQSTRYVDTFIHER